MRKVAFFILMLLLCAFGLGAQAQELKAECEQGNSQACFNLGTQTQYSDKKLAFWAFEKACNLGNGEACYRMAFVYNWIGKDSISPCKARKYLRAGCKLGYQPACTALEDIWKWEV